MFPPFGQYAAWILRFLSRCPLFATSLFYAYAAFCPRRGALHLRWWLTLFVAWYLELVSYLLLGVCGGSGYCIYRARRGWLYYFLVVVVSFGICSLGMILGFECVVSF